MLMTMDNIIFNTTEEMETGELSLLSFIRFSFKHAQIEYLKFFLYVTQLQMNQNWQQMEMVKRR